MILFWLDNSSNPVCRQCHPTWISSKTCALARSSSFTSVTRPARSPRPAKPSTPSSPPPVPSGSTPKPTDESARRGEFGRRVLRYLGGVLAEGGAHALLQAHHHPVQGFQTVGEAAQVVLHAVQPLAAHPRPPERVACMGFRRRGRNRGHEGEMGDVFCVFGSLKSAI